MNGDWCVVDEVAQIGFVLAQRFDRLSMPEADKRHDAQTEHREPSIDGAGKDVAALAREQCAMTDNPSATSVSTTIPRRLAEDSVSAQMTGTIQERRAHPEVRAGRPRGSLPATAAHASREESADSAHSALGTT